LPLQELVKTLKMYLSLAGPGVIVMVSDNDADGITTYSVTGATYGYILIGFSIVALIIDLSPATPSASSSPACWEAP
jgi:Mn2+/Fe2+ NRAMP family transporter